jgi:hypothetical protein
VTTFADNEKFATKLLKQIPVRRTSVNDAAADSCAGTMSLHRLFALVTVGGILFGVTGCDERQPDTVKDEAMQAGRTAASFPAADEDYFADMDGGYKRASNPSLKLSKQEVEGRNTWIVWTGGNDRFWDYMANNTFGAFDLLKILSSNPHVGYCEDPSGKPFERSAYSELSEADCNKQGLVWFTPNRSNRFDWYITPPALARSDPPATQMLCSITISTSTA